MRKTLLLFILTTICVAFAGCTISRITVTSTTTYPPLKDKSMIKAYLYEEYVQGFEELAVIEVYKSDSGKLYLDDAVDEARSVAMNFGANCIILIRDFFRADKHEPYPSSMYFRIGIKR